MSESKPSIPAISESSFDSRKADEKRRLPTSPFGFDETMARVMRVKPEPKVKKQKPA